MKTRLSVLVLALTLLTSVPTATAFASPSSLGGCNKAIAIGYTSVSFFNGNVIVNATLDKLVDSYTYAFCGSLRTHAQVVIKSGTYSGAILTGYERVGSSSLSGNDTYYGLTGKSATSAGTWDNWGPWEPGNCGMALADFVYPTGATHDSTYPSNPYAAYCV